MHFVKATAVFLPILATGLSVPMPEDNDIDMDNVIVLTPTIEELQLAYPDVIFNNTGADLVAREITSIGNVDQRTLGYKLVAGGLSMIGYFSLGGGCDQAVDMVDSCSNGNIVSVKCFLRGTAAFFSHALTFAAGFVGGRQFIQYFWHGGALQAAGLPPAQKMIRACNTDQQRYNVGYHFSGQYGMKIASKNMHCYSPDSGQLGYVSSLGSMVAQKMYDMNMNGQCTLSTQCTIYETSSNLVLSRNHLEIDTVRTDVCPFTITGGDSCTVST